MFTKRPGPRASRTNRARLAKESLILQGHARCGADCVHLAGPVREPVGRVEQGGETHTGSGCLGLLTFSQSHALLCPTCTHKHDGGDPLRGRLRGDITVADRRHGCHLEQPISLYQLIAGSKADMADRNGKVNGHFRPTVFAGTLCHILHVGQRKFVCMLAVRQGQRAWETEVLQDDTADTQANTRTTYRPVHANDPRFADSGRVGSRLRYSLVEDPSVVSSRTRPRIAMWLGHPLGFAECFQRG